MKISELDKWDKEQLIDYVKKLEIEIREYVLDKSRLGLTLLNRLLKNNKFCPNCQKEQYEKLLIKLGIGKEEE